MCFSSKSIPSDPLPVTGRGRGGASPFVVHKVLCLLLRNMDHLNHKHPSPSHSLDEGKGRGGRTVSLDIDAELLTVEYEAGGFTVARNAAARLQVAALNIAQLLARRKL